MNSLSGLAVDSISKLLKKYRSEDISITDINGEILIDDSRDFER